MNRLRVDAWTAAAMLAMAASLAPCARADQPASLPPAAATQPENASLELPRCREDWGQVVGCVSGQRRGGVVSGWLKNGVRWHHMAMDAAPGSVIVTVSFVGGELLESAENRGITLGACSAWDALSIAGAPPGAVAEALGDRDVHIEALAGPDFMQLRIWGADEDIEHGMKVAMLLLTRPRVTPETLSETIRQGKEQMAARRAGSGMVAEALAEVIYPPAEVRTRFPSETQLDGITAEQAQAWLDKHIAAAPVEVSIVGDITLEEATRLVGGYLGDLPDRARTGPRVYAEQRRLPAPQFPIRREVTSAAVNPGHAVIVCGFPGADAANPVDLRTLRVAARILDARATAALAEAGIAEAEVSAGAIPAIVYPGFGLIVARVEVEEGRADEAAALLEAQITRMAAAGVASEEVQTAREDLARIVEQAERDPKYWAGILARADSAGVELDQVVDGPGVYRSLNAETVSAAVARNVGDGRIIRLVIRRQP